MVGSKCGLGFAQNGGPGALACNSGFAGGWFEVEVNGAGAATLYRFVMEDGSMAPDPASRFPYMSMVRAS